MAPQIPLHIYSAGAIRRGIDAIVRLMQADHGQACQMAYGSAPRIMSRVRSGEHAEVVILPRESLDSLLAEARIAGKRRVVAGRSRMAIVLKNGIEARDFSTREKVLTQFLAADALVHNEGSSGAAAAAFIDELGIRPAMGARIRVVENSGEMMRLVTTAPGVTIGLAQGTNALDHVARGAAITIQGHFPDEVGHVTTYEAALTIGAAASSAAGLFLDMMDSNAGRAALRATGLE